jgi:hypothetical protein
MQRFCYRVEDEELSDRLLNRIRGRGAFRRFKNTIHQVGIEQDWVAYRRQAFREIAIEWLESHQIPLYGRRRRRLENSKNAVYRWRWWHHPAMQRSSYTKKEKG